MLILRRSTRIPLNVQGSGWYGGLVTRLCPALVTPWTVAHQAPLSMGFPRQILEWVTISFSRGSSWPRDWTWVSCIAGRFFICWATREAISNYYSTNTEIQTWSNEHTEDFSKPSVTSWSHIDWIFVISFEVCELLARPGEKLIERNSSLPMGTTWLRLQVLIMNHTLFTAIQKPSMHASQNDFGRMN